MRPAIVRGVAFVAVAVSASIVMVLSDSQFPPGLSTSPAQTGVAPGLSPDSRNDFYSTHESVVPYGRTVLEFPILMYHYIRTPPSRAVDLVGYNLSVTPAAFTAQMDWLEAHGYHTVTFADIRRYWERVSPLPSKPVIITIDDGYQDLYTTAFPILVDHGFTAVAYIVSGFVGEPRYVTASEVLDMDRYGIEIGAHTVNHADLARASEPWLTYQVAESKAWLERLVGHPVIDMAYPSGKYNAEAVAAIERAGYWSSVTEQYTLLHTEADRFEWGRVRVAGGETLAMFVAELGPSMPTVMITRVVHTAGASDSHHLA